MGFFDKLKTVVDSAVVAMDKAGEKTAKRLSDTQLLDKIVAYPNNKFYNSEAQRRGLLQMARGKKCPKCGKYTMHQQRVGYWYCSNCKAATFD